MKKHNAQIAKIVEGLQKFSPEIIEFNPPVSNELIIKFENKYNIQLPDDYKQLLKITNGFNLMGDEVLGITFDSKSYDLARAYQFEHFETQLPMPKHLIPFSPDGGGNYYCFDTQKETNSGFSRKIVFYATDYEYNENDTPEETHECLSDFINECIINWTLEDYNYDGSKKSK